jgi:hypothetical protein
MPPTAGYFSSLSTPLRRRHAAAAAAAVAGRLLPFQMRRPTPLLRHYFDFDFSPPIVSAMFAAPMIATPRRQHRCSLLFTLFMPRRRRWRPTYAIIRHFRFSPPADAAARRHDAAVTFLLPPAAAAEDAAAMLPPCR